MVAKFFGKFKTAKKPNDPKNGAAPSKTKPIKSKMKPSPNPKSESLATPSGTPRSTRATPNPAGSATNGKPGKPKPKITLPIIISIILGVIILLMTIAAVLYFVLKPSEEPANVCETPQCVFLAHQLLNWRGENVDPCDDFYEYTCGKYTEQVNANSIALNWKRNLLVNSISNYLEKVKTPKRVSEVAMKGYFIYCKGGSFGLDDDSLRDLYKDLQEIGKWPMADSSFNSADFKINDYLSNIATMFPFFGFFGFDDDNVYSPRIIITKDKLDLREFQNAKNVIDKILTLHGKDTSSVQADLDQLVEFVNKTINAQSQLDTTKFVKLDEKDISQTAATVNFQSIFTKLLSEKQLSHYKNHIVIHPDFFKGHNLDDLISNANEKILANFLIVRSIIAAQNLVIPKFSTDCPVSLLYAMPQAALNLMIRHYLDKKNLEAVSGIVEEIRSTFRTTVGKSAWLQESSKKKALKKLEKMRKIIGYSEEFLDSEKFERRFEKKVMPKKQDSTYRSIVRLRQFKKNFEFDEAASGQSIITGYALTRSNGAYDEEANVFILTLNYLDDPFFDASFPKYAQIGEIGYETGTLMAAVSTSTGALFDENGNEQDWWTQKDKTAFEKINQCVIEKYENYDDPIFGRNQLNGTLAANNIVTRLLGAQAAWDTFKKVDVTKEQKLLGLENYSIDKLFFQIMGTKYCTPLQIGQLQVAFKDGYITANYVVNGVFSNMKEFAETFNCPVGSKMNPAKRCELF